MTNGRNAFVFRFLLGGCAFAVAAFVAALHCAGGDDSQPDHGALCTLEACMNSCLESSRPGGHCDGDLCICDDALPDADGDADGDGDGDADTPDRADTREDGREVREDGEAGEVPETTEDGEAVEARDDAAREDIPYEDAGPRCSDLSTAWTFNTGDSGWTHAAIDPPATGEFDPWERGAPTAGPAECHGGGSTNRCWATGLAGNYPTCQRAELRSPTTDLSPCATSSFHVDLVFWQWHEFAQASGANDGGTVEVSGDDGATWVQVAPSAGWDGPIDMDAAACDGSIYVDGLDGFLGSSGRWVQETIRVPAEYLTELFAFRFAFGSDGATSAAGWFLDDVAVVVR